MEHRVLEGVYSSGTIGRGGDVDGIEAERCNCVGDAVFNREAVESFENGSDVCILFLGHERQVGLHSIWL